MGNELRGNKLVCVGIPRERTLLPGFVDSRDILVQFLRESGLFGGMIQQSGCRIDQNRNSIVKAFLEDSRQPEFLLFLDNDMEFPRQIGQVLSMRRLPVVGGLYFKWGDNYDPVCYGIGEVRENEWGVLTQFYDPLRDAVFDFFEANNIPFINHSFVVVNPKTDPLLPCRVIGTGAMMVHRSVFEKLSPPWFVFNGTNGEDFYFCERVNNELGYQIYCDLSVVCGHIAFKTVGLPQFLESHRYRGYLVTQLGRRQAVESLAEFFGVEQEAAEAELAENGLPAMLELWTHMCHDVHGTDDFYRRPEVGRLYLRKLLLRDSSSEFHAMRRNLVNYRNCRVLEVGSGAGTIAMQMALQKCHVTAVEPNDVMREFAQYRWETLRKWLTPSILYGEIEWKPEIPGNGGFDLVIGSDIFGRVHPEGLDDLLRQIGQVTPERGMLFHPYNWELCGQYPFYYNHSAYWSYVLKSGGFYEVQPPLWSMKIE